MKRPSLREILLILSGAVALVAILSVVIYVASRWGPHDSRSFLTEPSGPTGQLLARPTTVPGTRPTPSADASKRAIVGSG